MPKLKSLLKRIDIEVAQRRRTCKFTGEGIVKGETCIVIFDGPREASGYCRSIALQMISDARKRLAQMEEALS